MFLEYSNYQFNNGYVPQYFEFAFPRFTGVLPMINFKMPTLPAVEYDNTNFFSFLNNNNNSSIRQVVNETTSEVKGQRTVTRKERRAALNVVKDSDGLGPEFLVKVKQVAKSLNCNYKDLLAVMNAESGLKGDAWNGTSAVGLIQFTSLSIADLNQKYGLNLTKEKIAAMPEIDQLDLVEKYLKLAKGYGGFSKDEKLSAGDLYAIVFLPGRAGRDVLCTKGEKGKNGKLLGYYEGNPIDLNGDKKITKSELVQRTNNFRVNESIFA